MFYEKEWLKVSNLYFCISNKLHLRTRFVLDIDECTFDTNPCSNMRNKRFMIGQLHDVHDAHDVLETTECVNTFGSYNCICKPGFSLESGVCEGISYNILGRYSKLVSTI